MLKFNRNIVSEYLPERTCSGRQDGANDQTCAIRWGSRGRAVSPHGQKGFTLIETILAMMVVAIGIFGTMHLFYDTVNRAYETDAYIQATALAHERLEEITFDKKMNGYGFIVTANYPTTENLTGVYSAYTRTVTILEVNSSDLNSSQNNSGYKKVTVTVSWSGGSVTLDTLLTFWGEV